MQNNLTRIKNKIRQYAFLPEKQKYQRNKFFKSFDVSNLRLKNEK